MSKNKLLIYLSVIVIITILMLLNINNKRKGETEYVNLASLALNLYDTSWIIGNSCESGCWNGLTPGKTSREDTITTIKSLSFVNNDNFYENESSLYFFCNPPMDKTGCGTLIFEGGLLEHIFLSPNYLIPMDQAVEILGIPDGYSCFPTDPGATGYELSIYYTKKQLILAYRENRKELLTWRKNVCDQITVEGKLPTGYPIEDVHFIYPYTIDEMTGSQPWVGFAE